MKKYVFEIQYRQRFDTKASIHIVHLESSSLKSAKLAFSIWQYEKTGRWKYIPVKITRLREIKKVEPELVWVKKEPGRPKSQIYVCPYCKDTCYAAYIGCDYKFCPRCGHEV